jgi:diguanylate cyclase (GGDEF)-like protein
LFFAVRGGGKKVAGSGKKSRYDTWRYYGLEREEYTECISRTFVNNIYSLRAINMVSAVMAACYMLFPIAVEGNWPKAGIYLIASVFGGVMALLSKRLCSRHAQGKRVGKQYVYTLVILFYGNAMLFGTYIGVWSNTELSAVTFMGFLISALFLFNNPPIFNAALTFGAMAIFTVSTVLMKEASVWVHDVTNMSIAGIISLIFTWYVTRHKMLAALNASKLESERNRYYDQSMVDELTQLKNRRDFDQTFYRYLTNYRDSDIFLCLAILDIDFFKEYNDHNGHLKGDECLRAVGQALADLRDVAGVYAARVGGEEFALLWFQKDQDGAGRLAAGVQRRIRDLNIPHANSSVSPLLTVSLGIYMARCGSKNDAQTVYEQADGALYEAKRNGRNCAVIWNEDGEKSTLHPPPAA